ncbi:MAG: tyrosine-type recombinase/integrase [Planctomycetota bacterium]
MKKAPSILQLVQQYLAERHQQGYRMFTEGAELLRFARYAAVHAPGAPVSTELVVAWAKLPVKGDACYWARRFEIVRRFAPYAKFYAPRTELLPIGLLGPPKRKRPTPHIYTESELAALLDAARHLAPPNGLRAWTCTTLLGLLACTGLRIGEAVRLQNTDVGLEAGLLHIQHGKGDRSRWVPLHSTAVQALRRYMKRRNQVYPHPATNAFFLTADGTAMHYRRALHDFWRLRKRLGWSVLSHPRRPRLHDLRHTFAVRRLLLWYRQRRNIDHHIAALATYMGHLKFTSTYWYLTAIPELMALVTSRFEKSNPLTK